MKSIGDIRRSQVLSGNGPGAVIVFRGPGGSPVSVVAAGLEGWDEFSLSKGLMNHQRIEHETLEKKLKVGGFRLPPVGLEYSNRKGVAPRATMLPVYRFPNWHVCPKCNLLQKTEAWEQERDGFELSCPTCSEGTGGRRRKKVHVTPVRFLVTCVRGHLQDFPWDWWPQHAEECGRSKPLTLIGEGAGLKGLSVHCTDCGAARNLDGALSPGGLGPVVCRGDRPWLKETGDGCQEKPVAVQRGASNVYFPVIVSALEVPPFGSRLQDELGDDWENLCDLDDLDQVPLYVEKRIIERWPDQEATVGELSERILRILRALRAEHADLRAEEYAVLSSGDDFIEADYPDFQIFPEDVPAAFEGLVSLVVSVERLREVRVLKNFTRLTPPTDPSDETRFAGIFKTDPKWLPAIDVRGEGIFISFDPARLLEWERRPEVIERAQIAEDAALQAWQEFNGGDRPFPLDISPRFLVIHTTAHALAERLSRDSGYSTASIRERLYVSPGAEGMCGFLLYTSAPDSDGTLGGLSRLARPATIGPMLEAAIRDLEWCSSDPLCGSGVLSLSEGSGLAACHCCTFVPETTCEHFNRHLDRVMVVGSAARPDLGYFHELIA